MKNTLRWIAVPFASIGSMWAAYILASLICGLNGSIVENYYGVEVTSITKIILALARNGISGYAMVYFGSLVAPSKNKIVAIVLATVSCFIVALGILSLFVSGFNFMSFLEMLATGIGSIVAVKEVKEKEE